MLDCIFCRIANHEIAATIVYEDDQLVAFEDIAPQAPVHVLIVPKRHVRSLAELREADGDVVQHLMLTAKHVATLTHIDLSGYRVVLNCNPDGGQTVYHMHAHLLGGRQLNWPPG